MCAVLASILAGRAVRSLLAGGLVLAVLAFGISRLDLVQEAQLVFQERWEKGQVSDAPDQGIGGILVNRIGGSFLQAFGMVGDVNLFGMGIGLGTNVGAVRSIGQKGFVVAEGAWPAMVGELGPILGFALILWRVLLAGRLALLSCRQALMKNTLPLILGGISLQSLVIGQTSQPTALGFVVVCAGWMLAACNSQPIAVPRDHGIPEMEEANFGAPV